MTNEIKEFIRLHGALTCPSCEGEGENETFSGHYHSENCWMCAGKGLIRSLKLQQNHKPCDICKEKAGGCGGCNFNPKGRHEWESWEIY